MPSAYMLLPTCCKPVVLAKRAMRNLAERALGTVREHAADQTAFGDREAGERARREAVLARHVHVADRLAWAVGAGETADLS